MKRVFVLEDDPNRISWFVDQFKKYDYKYDITQDVKLAKHLLTTEKFDMIFLDHDLGGQQMVDSDDPNTGYQVAKVIPNSINHETHIIIHSYNPTGSAKMEELLRVARCNVFAIPFGMFDINGNL